MTAEASATDWTSCPVAVEAGLWFRYGRQKRPEVTALSTFDAVLNGERSSTTRFLRWPGHDLWATVKPGDLIRFHEQQDHKGRSLVVRALSVEPINLLRCGAAALEIWSLHEGWSPEKGHGLGAELGPALWIRHELMGPQQARRPVQMSMF